MKLIPASARDLEAELIDSDSPLRLHDAARIAFPHGGMSVSALRREAQRGRLVISRIAGKDFTTINDIRRMVELCRVKQSHRDSTSNTNSEIKPVESLTLPCGLSSMEVANTALAAALTTLTEKTKL
jgi:hypothetical protein